jgi:hypothetical protein
MWEEEQEEPMNQICLRPWQHNSGFHKKIHLILSLFKKNFWIPVFIVGSFMGENLKIKL